jgi:hypothetical protein
MTKTHVIRQGTEANLSAITIAGVAVDTAVLLASGQSVDLNGETGGIIFDADANTKIYPSADDVITINVAGASDFTIAANLLTALSGSSIATNTIAETTAASGVTVDGLLIKDAGLVVGTSGALDLNGETGGIIFDADANTKIYPSAADEITINVGGASDFVIAANLLTALSGSVIATNTISETTAASGVTIDGVLVKDTAVLGRTHILAITADGAITIPAYNIHYFFTKAGVAAMTIADPTATTHDGVTLTFVATTANANTVSNAAGSGFWSSGGAGKDIATFGGAIGDGFTIIAYQGKWYIDPRGVTNVTLG